MYKHLLQETRLKTLELYKALLKSSTQYNNLGNAIRQQFKANKYTTSRKKTLALLTEAEHVLNFLERGNNGDKRIVSKVNEYVQKYTKPTQPLPDEPKKKQKRSKIVERKSYQVAITVRHALGFEFKRVRGWRQPVQTSMMIKNRVKATQKKIDKYNDLKLQLEMVRGERLFLQNLKCLPKDRLYNYEDNIKWAMEAYSIIKDTQKQHTKTNLEDDL
ncbi:hypothetical protein [Parasitella parasitica]|uniref:Uncharacterized protein n=1 Tax=Parasitella parasitica TaxID=35722 RepID=A0A0B7MUI5_9FUNG|nr:hypothetical protein [Parasitella parasitica]